jgi:hypothetical protein
MESLIFVATLGVFFLGYSIYRVEAEIRETKTQINQILKALDPLTYRSIGYELVKSLDKIEGRLRN